MILFIALISTANLALGFGLAVYLLRTGEMPRRLMPRHFAIPRAAASTSDAPVEKLTIPPTADVAVQQDAAGDEEAPATITDSADAVEGPDPDAAQPEVEEDVLAGIEAFRAQLAQMKDEPAPEAVNA